MLEDQTPLIPLALWAVNLSERSGRPDLLMMNQAGLGNSLTAAGLRQLARSYVRAAVAAADRSSDPVAISWTYIWPLCTGWPSATGRRSMPGCPGRWRWRPGPGCTGSWTRWSCSPASAGT